MAVVFPRKASTTRSAQGTLCRLTAPTIPMGLDGASREVIDQEY